MSRAEVEGLVEGGGRERMGERGKRVGTFDI